MFFLSDKFCIEKIELSDKKCETNLCSAVTNFKNVAVCCLIEGKEEEQAKKTVFVATNKTKNE